MKLGEVVERPTICGTWQFIATSAYPDGTVLLTPLPPGMDAMDLGRKFPAARIERATE